MFGRVTYELMANHWPNATGEVADFMNALPKFVFLAHADEIPFGTIPGCSTPMFLKRSHA